MSGFLSKTKSSGPLDCTLTSWRIQSDRKMKVIQYVTMNSSCKNELLLLNRDVIIPGGTFVLVTLKSFLDAIHFK